MAGSIERIIRADNEDRGYAPRMLVLIGLGALITAATGTAIAKADPVDDYTTASAPAICAVLDQDPSIAGVQSVLVAIMADGVPPRPAGEIVARSVVGWCPSHLPEVQAFVAKWSSARAVA